jgi:preprotein translocase subunit SecY
LELADNNFAVFALGNRFMCYSAASAIIFFCFFYTALVFNPRETTDNLKKSGAFVPGIRPGEQTAKYIDKVMTRLTLVGVIYITFICLIPEFMINKVPFSRWDLTAYCCRCDYGLYKSVQT